MPECQMDSCLYCGMNWGRHPNLFLIYDPVKGVYVHDQQYAEARLGDVSADLCSARWKTSTIGDHDAGEICGRRAVEQVGDSPVCRHHYERAQEWVRWQADQARDEFHARRDEAARQRAAERPPLVYFVERDGFVKIGYSTNLDKRLKDISRGSCLAEGMTVGPVRLLATIPGAGPSNEKALHRKFAHLRVGGEWFLFDDEIRAFVAGLKGYIAQEPQASPALLDSSDSRPSLAAIA